MASDLVSLFCSRALQVNSPLSPKHTHTHTHTQPPPPLIYVGERFVLGQSISLQITIVFQHKYFLRTFFFASGTSFVLELLSLGEQFSLEMN